MPVNLLEKIVHAFVHRTYMTMRLKSVKPMYQCLKQESVGNLFWTGMPNLWAGTP